MKNGKRRLDPAERIIVALDVKNFDEMCRLLDVLGDSISFFKVGLQLYTSSGYNVIQELRARGKRIFLDLKFHDIPNTVASVCRVVSSFGVDLCNVHALGGRDMMMAAAAAVRESEMRLLAVTLLTSHSEATVSEELHISLGLREEVLELAGLAAGAGMDGVVCSPEEVEAVRERLGEDFLTVTPGVRPIWAAANDQQRFTTPRQALARGADYLVLGRPITAADNPSEAAARIIDEICGC